MTMQLITERLVMRDFRSEDWQAVLAYQSDPLYLRYNPWTERTPEAVREFIQMFLDQQRAEPRIKFQLALELKANGQLIGNCGIRLRSAEACEADIGCELDPHHWGKGYATEAVSAILHLGFAQFGLHRISAHCVADNIGSQRVLEKIGMRLEGRLRENECYRDRYWDTLLYAILEDEWQALEPAAKH